MRFLVGMIKEMIFDKFILYLTLPAISCAILKHLSNCLRYCSSALGFFNTYQVQFLATSPKNTVTSLPLSFHLFAKAAPTTSGIALATIVEVPINATYLRTGYVKILSMKSLIFVKQNLIPRRIGRGRIFIRSL